MRKRISSLMVRTASIVVLLFTAQCTHAQVGFNRTYGLYDQLHFNKVVAHEDKLVVLGTAVVTDSVSKWAVVIFEVDTSGRLGDHNVILDTAGTWLEVLETDPLIRTKDGGYLATCFPFPRSTIMLLRFDDNLNLLWRREYDRGGHTIAIAENDTGYILVGFIRTQDAKSQGWIRKVDVTGSELWYKEFGNTVFHDYAMAVHVVDSDTILIGGRSVYDAPGPFLEDNERINWIRCVDSTGTMHWEWRSPVNSEGMLADLKVMPNGQYVYSARIITIVPDETWYPYGARANYGLYCRDDTFGLVWKSEIGEPTAQITNVHSVLQAGDGFVTVGYRPISPGPEPSQVSGWVTKFSEAGEVLWEVRDSANRPDKGHPAINFLYGGAMLESGSVVTAGYAFQPYMGREFGWLLKISSDGCVDTLCYTTTLDKLINAPKSKIEVYPNPASSLVTFSFSPALSHPAILQIFDLQGRIVSMSSVARGPDQHSVDVSGLPEGMYLYSVQEDGMVVGSGRVVVVR